MHDKKTVLIIDDDEGNRDLLGAMLEIGGYSVLKAADGSQGLAILKLQRADVVLLDVMMPGMNGYEVCRAIKTNPELMSMPVVMVTALFDDGSRNKAFTNGADAFLTKPLGFDVLIRNVEEFTHAAVAV